MEGWFKGIRTFLKTQVLRSASDVIGAQTEHRMGAHRLTNKSVDSMERKTGSNPRRPAWEDDCQLDRKRIVFPGTRFWQLRMQRLHPVLSSRPKRSTHGAHEWKMA